jgi:hypothetical protein
MSSITKLTTSVDQLAGEANVTKAQLNAKVAQADMAVADIQAEQAATEAARDEAGTYATDATTHLATVKADVTYQGISAILAGKAMTAVDVFVYDTSLDSDGGAWRMRCQHTSWHNEQLNTATRGARSEFPVVAIIVAETDTVTIYDADDTTLPMWMVFYGATTYSQKLISYGDAGSIRAVSALNGILVVGTSSGSANQGANGVFRIDLVGDRAIKYCNSQLSTEYDAVLSTRNSGGYNNYLSGISLPRLASNFHNDVAMTVLPDAPTDPATGLPVPTIAVATSEGISVIKDDGSIVDIVNYVTAPPTVSFANVSGLPRIVATSRYSNWLFVIDVPSTDVNSGPYLDSLLIGGAAAFFSEFTDDEGVIHAATNRGLKLYAKDQGFVGANKNAASMPMSAIIRAGSTSGWMMRSTAGSFLSDISATSLVEPPEMVVNGGFDTDTDWGKGAGWSISDGVISVDGTQTSNSNLTQTLSTVLGQTYAIRVKVLARSGGASAYFYWGTTSFGSITQPGEYTFYRTWLGGTPILYFTVNAGVTITMDDISVVPVDENRSPSNAGLFVNGTITRSPVADGAELVGYYGFSETNYLEQPYNSALDTGTGDFCVMGWVYNPSIYDTFVSRSDGAGNGWYLQRGNGQFWFSSTVGGSINGGTIPSSGWSLVTLLQKSGTTYAYVNRTLQGTGANTANMSIPAGVLRVGAKRPDLAGAIDNMVGKMALWRVSAAAPTPDQIAKIYEDERKLFMSGAQCTLYGTSDAVMALAHDPKTNLLHVGTSAGRSTFDGLVRVAYTETPVGTAISAVNGLIAEQ